MQEAAWQGNNEGTLPNGAENSGMRNSNTGQGVRSQDDAAVGYFFQRPQTDMSQHFPPKRWMIGDDSALEHVRAFVYLFTNCLSNLSKP